MDFKEFRLDEKLLKGIDKAGYVTCTPVQEEVLKTALDGTDLYVQSQTGTGKTAAYLIPLIQELLAHTEEIHAKKALILVPTRELAVQVNEEAKTLLTYTGITAGCFYGGVGYDQQISALKKGIDIIIGTPGRIIDLQESHKMNLSEVSYLVIDEADRMFDMGFYPDLRTLITVLSKAEDRQTMLFSATLNSYVKNLAWEYTRDAKEITIEADNIVVNEIDQELIHVSSDEKMKLLLGILTNEKPDSVLIFCNTKRSCEVISKRLHINGFQSDFIIGDLPQVKRLKVLNRFKEGEISILVATDVAARGIDVSDLSMVVNYDLPNEAENYVHRIGRTARAGKAGKAYTLCSEQNVYNLPSIERYIEMELPSKVADSSMLVEDKSKDIYIKTEYRRDDRESFSYDNNRRKSSRRKSDRNTKTNYKSLSKAKNYKRSSERPNNHGSEDRKNLQNMEKMSLDERMKLYKEKYGNKETVSSRNNKTTAKNSSSNTNKKYHKDGNKTQKSQRKSNGYKKSSYSSNGKDRKNSITKQYSGKRMVFKTNKPVIQNKKPAKKGFIARLKSLFGKKN